MSKRIERITFDSFVESVLRENVFHFDDLEHPRVLVIPELLETVELGGSTSSSANAITVLEE